MYRIGLPIAAVVLLLDQLSKWWIRVVVMDPPRDIEVTSFFKLVLALNPGISFSLFRAGSPAGAWILAGLAAAIAVGLLIWLGRADRRWLAVALGFIIGGALGNIVDRLRFHAVVDFLYFHIGSYYWPAFNLADSAITVGVAVLVIDGLFGRPESAKKAPHKGR
jgi:signal peptidase II